MRDSDIRNRRSGDDRSETETRHQSSTDTIRATTGYHTPPRIGEKTKLREPRRIAFKHFFTLRKTQSRVFAELDLILKQVERQKTFVSLHLFWHLQVPRGVRCARREDLLHLFRFDKEKIILENPCGTIACGADWSSSRLLAPSKLG